MPKLSIPDDWKPLQRKFEAADATNASKLTAEADDGEHPKVIRLDQRQLARKPESTSTPSAPVPEDPRLSFLRGHFGLMQEFLDSQARVLSQFTVASASGATAPEAPLAPAAPTGASDELPLLGTISEHTATRLVCERRFDESTDIFLNDHAIGTTPSALQPQLRSLQVVPFTFSMEIVAEAAVKLLGTPYRVAAMNEIRGHRWLTLDMGSLALRVTADRQPAQNGLEAVGAKIFLLGSGGPPGGLLVFEATVLLSASLLQAVTPMPWSTKPERAIAVTADADLYRKGMFHGPRLQGIKHLRRWADDAIEADMEVLPTHDYFTFTQRPRFQIDAALIDAVGQLAGYWLAEQHGWILSCFPFRVGRYEQYGEQLPPGTRVIGRAQLIRTPAGLEANFDLIGPDGRLFARLAGWEDRVFEMPDRFAAVQRNAQELLSQAMPSLQPGVSLRVLPALPENFLTAGFAIWMRVLAYVVLNASERQQFYALPASGPRREEWLMGRIAAKEALREWARRSTGRSLASADFEILADANGRPYAQCALMPGVALPSISISHTARSAAVALAATLGHTVGIDFQQMGRVDLNSLLTGGFNPSEIGIVQTAPPVEQVRLAVALWSAKEAAAKASGLGFAGRPLDWRAGAIYHVSSPADPIQVLHAEVYRGNERYDVIVSVAEGGVLAVCEHAAATASGVPTLEAV
jgi:phosphopantetheinyl transferase